jgi:hypothetical protein
MIRDLTKSMLSGIEQLTNTLLPQKPSQPTHRATATFNAVTQATEAQFDTVLKGVFKAGDTLQRGVVDLMFGCLSLETYDPSQIMRMTSDTMRQTTGAFSQSFRSGPSASQAGWGPQAGHGQSPSP